MKSQLVIGLTFLTLGVGGSCLSAESQKATVIHAGQLGPVAGLVGIDGGIVSGVTNLESPGVRAPIRRPRHEEGYHDA